jgi:hypothetical protein
MLVKKEFSVCLIRVNNRAFSRINAAIRIKNIDFFYVFVPIRTKLVLKVCYLKITFGFSLDSPPVDFIIGNNCICWSIGRFRLFRRFGGYRVFGRFLLGRCF